MAINTENITLELIGGVLGFAYKDVGDVCISPLINKWSKYKPIRGNSPESSNGFYGLDPNNNWEYLRPRNDFWLHNDEGFDIGHFRSYEHDQSLTMPPLFVANTNTSLNTITNYDSTTNNVITVGINTNSGQPSEITLTDMGLENYFFAVKLYQPSSGQYAWKSLTNTAINSDGDELTVDLNNEFPSNFNDDGSTIDISFGISANSSSTMAFENPASFIALPEETVNGISLVNNYQFSYTNYMFVADWSTTYTTIGSSNDNQIKLPLESTGTYDFTVYWGDGSSDTITTYDQAEVTHTYASTGVYKVSIESTCTGWRFNFGGDRNKIKDIFSWGKLRLGANDANFYGCTNLKLNNVSNTLDLTGTTTLHNTFRQCTSLTTINNINSWDTSAILDTGGMFREASNFNQDLSFNTSNVVIMSSMFYWAENFNGNLSFDTSNVTDMSNMFALAYAFNRDISSFDISSIIYIDNFMYQKTSANYSSANYDALLNAWSLLTLTPDLAINFGTIQYTVTGQTGRDILTSAPNNWVITDGGLV